MIKAFFKGFIPFEETSQKKKTAIMLGWLFSFFGIWFINAFIGTTHLFPTPKQVLDGFISLWQQGLATHLASSLWLCARAIVIAVSISLVLVYLSPLQYIHSLSLFVSKMRYLPMTGLTFYISVVMSNARTMQIWILVIFISTYLITGLLGMIADIPLEDYDHARTIKCSRWEMLWEVVIKGRLDYVIETIRQNLAISWMMLVTVEALLAAGGGVGFLIKNSDKMGNNGKMVALQFIILFFGLTLDFVLTMTRKLMFRYSKI